jgi:hypothetical protein
MKKSISALAGIRMHVRKCLDGEGEGNGVVDFCTGSGLSQSSSPILFGRIHGP